MRNGSSPSYLPLLTSIILLALLGTLDAVKVPTGDECINSVVLCYECDSREDPNCNDPFEFRESQTMIGPNQFINHSDASIKTPTQPNQANPGSPNRATTNQTLHQKRLPPAMVCHGCCVKLTSKLGDGTTYVRRTCTINLQINYFMVGLVCMKESGDRGKMCFCETDYCNGQTVIQPNFRLAFALFIASILFIQFGNTPIKLR